MKGIGEDSGSSESASGINDCCRLRTRYILNCLYWRDLWLGNGISKYLLMVFSQMVVCVCLAKAEGDKEGASVVELPLLTTKL